MENNTLVSKLESINEQLNLVHYWIIFLKYKKIFLIAPILLALLGFFIALNINPIFQSQATLVIEESTKNIVNIDEVYGGDSRGAFGNNNYINNQIQIIESDEVIGSITSQEAVTTKAEKLYKKIPKSYLSLNKFNIFNSLPQDKAKELKKPNNLT